MPATLSKLERRILDYLVDYLRRNTYQPSIREIGKRFGIKSTKTVSEHLQALADKGFIERDASRSRGVRIVGTNLFPQVLSIPCYGAVGAGERVLLKENVTDELTLDRKLVSALDAFFLQVNGDSMHPAGILDGDLVLVEPTILADLEQGEIVAARLGGEGTVKKFFSRDDDIVLEPANTEYAPTLVRDYEDFSLLGRVSGVFRRLPPRSQPGD
jgi:repressor LexA